MAGTGRDDRSNAHGDSNGLHRAQSGSELASLLVVAADLPTGGGARVDVPLLVRAALRIYWATPEEPAIVRPELKVKPKMQFLHG
jgi:hypothetical protein